MSVEPLDSARRKLEEVLVPAEDGEQTISGPVDLTPEEIAALLDATEQ